MNLGIFFCSSGQPSSYWKIDLNEIKVMYTLWHVMFWMACLTNQKCMYMYITFFTIFSIPGCYFYYFQSIKGHHKIFTNCFAFLHNQKASLCTICLQILIIIQELVSHYASGHCAPNLEVKEDALFRYML